jgi:von Willebrand factor type A domain
MTKEEPSVDESDSIDEFDEEVGYKKGKGRKKVSSYSGGWWFDDYGFDTGAGSRAMKRHGITSLTGMGRSLMGSYATFTYDNKNEKLRDALVQLSRSANLLVNNRTGEERLLNVKYSDGKSKNDVSGNTIFVSPDNISGVKGKKYDLAMDALTGKVLLGSQLRKTVDKRLFREVTAKDRSKMEPADVAAFHLWKSIEGSVARNEVIQDWCGLSPYFVRYSEASKKVKDSITKMLDMAGSGGEITAEPLIAGLSWNLFHDSDPVKIPDVYREGVQAFAEVIKDPIKPEERYDACKKIADAIYKIYPTMMQKSGGGSGEGKGEGGDGPSGDGIPDAIDDDLFGGEVANEKSKSAATISVAPDEYGGVPNPHFQRPEYSELGSFIPQYVIEKFDGKELDIAGYQRLVRQLRREIEMVRGSLIFRNTERSIYDHGMHSGYLDEGSLYKIACNDDRLWERKEIIGESDVAIMILIDQSGSMCGSCGKGTKTDAAREVAVAIYEGAKQIRGVHICVLGFDSQHTCAEEVYIFEYFTPDKQRPERIMHMKSGHNNLDGFAISYAAMRLYNLYQNVKSKYVFVISDGSPSGHGYGGEQAYKHVHDSAEKARARYGCFVYGIGVDNAYDDTLGTTMYGKGNFVVLNDVKSSLMILTRFIREIALRR